MNTYRNLLSFGYWKKLVYLTQTLTALDLCYKFCNVEHFKMIKDNFIDSTAISDAKKEEISKVENELVMRDYMLTRNTIQNLKYANKEDVDMEEYFKDSIDFFVLLKIEIICSTSKPIVDKIFLIRNN